MNDEWISDILNDPSKDFSNIYTKNDDNDDEQSDFIPLKDSQYYIEDDFLGLLNSKNYSNKNSLKIVTLNIANLLSKLSGLKTLINRISNEENRPNLIVITETHLKHEGRQGYDENELVNLLPGYKFFHCDRKRKKGGGVGFFIENELALRAEVETEGYFVEEVFEGMIIKIPKIIARQGNGPLRDLVVLGLYRQPGTGNIDQFLNLLEATLTKIDKNSNEIIVSGDMNLDLLKYESHTPTSRYLDIMVAHKLLPAIVRPTRIKNSSATLIDHFFTRGEDTMGSGILLSEITGNYGQTDHFPIFCILRLKPEINKKDKFFLKSFFTTDGHKKRREGLKKHNWQNLYSKNDPNEIYDQIQETYCMHYQQNLTTKMVKANSYRYARDPWITTDILKDMKKRDRLFKKRDKKEEYKRLRNEIVKKVRNAEREFTANRINESWNNIKEQWKTLKKVINKTNDKTGIPSAFQHNGRWINDTEEIACHMNDYYSQVGPKTNEEVGESKKTADFYLNKNMEKNINSILTSNFCENDIVSACKKLNLKKSSDAYGISQAILLTDIDQISLPVTHLMNRSLSHGVCPDSSKIARVIPVYKNKGDRHLFTNYRPISLLPAISKIMEKLIYDKIFSFLVRYQILFKSQYGFRKGHNTTHATLDFLQTIEKALENDEYAIGIFCDLSKAFDTLNHEILIKKLEHYGIRGNFLAWLKSYLQNRAQFVDIDGVRSTCKPITVGVPQGSILGPLLFLIYVNDLPAALEKLRPIMFADDTNLILRGKNLSELKTVLENELNELDDYFKANKLKLNIDKTKLMCFRKKSDKFVKSDLNIPLDNAIINCVDEISFLGFVLDSHLSWDAHCCKVANKVSQITGLLGRFKKILPTKALKTLYNSLLMSHVQYGIEIWGGSSNKHKKRIIISQKRAIRHICKSYRLAHTEPRMKDLGLLRLPDQHQLQCAKLAYDIVNAKCPDTLKHKFELSINTHSHSLRSTSQNPLELRQVLTKKKSSSTSFSVLGPKIWNEVPERLKKLDNQMSFRKQLKKHILESYNNDTKCSNPLCKDRKFHSCISNS